MAHGVATIEPTESHRKLYDELVQRNLYSKSYDDFTNQFSTAEKRGKLYTQLKARNLYSKGPTQFERQFFDWMPREEPVKKKEPTPSEPSVGVSPSKEPEPKMSDMARLAMGEPIVSAAKSIWNLFRYQIPSSVQAGRALGTGIIPDVAQEIRERADIPTGEMPRQPGEPRQPEEKRVERTPQGKAAKQRQKDLLASAFDFQEQGAVFTEDLTTSLEQIESPLDFANWLGYAIGQAAGQIPLAIGTLGASGAIQEIGEVYLSGVRRIAEEQNLTPEEVIERGMDEPAIALAYGLGAASLEYIGARGVIKNFAKDAVRKELRQRGLSVLKSGVTEATTEGAQTIIEQIGAQVSGATKLADIRPEDIEWGEVIEAMAQGFVGGKAISTAGQVSQLARTREQISEEVAPTPPTEPVAEAEPTVEETRVAAQEAIQELEASTTATVEETRAAARAALAGIQEQVTPEPTVTEQPTEAVVEEPVAAPVVEEPAPKPEVKKKAPPKPKEEKKPEVKPKEVPRETPKKEAVKEKPKPIKEVKPKKPAPVVETKEVKPEKPKPTKPKAPPKPQKVAKAPVQAAAGATFTQPSKYTGKPIEYQNREGVWHYKDSKTGQWVPESAARQDIINDLYEGKEPTKLEQAREASKQSKAKLKEVLARDKVLGAALDPKQQAQRDYEVYQALFNHAKNLVREGYHTVEEFAKDLGATVTDQMRRAWTHAYERQLDQPLKQKDYASEVRSDEGQVQVGRPEREGRKEEGRKDIQQPKEARRPKPAPREEKKKAVPPVKGKQYGFQKTLSKKDLGDRAKRWIQEFSTNPANRLLYQQYNIAEAAGRILERVERKGGFEANHDTLIEKPTIENAADTQVERQLAMYYYGEQLENALDQGETAIADQYASMINQVQTRILKEANSMGKANASLQLWRALQPDGTIKYISQQIDKANEKVLDDIYEDFGVDNKEVVAQLQTQLKQARDEAAAAIQESDALRKALDKAKSKRQFQKRAISRKGKQLADTIRKNKLPKGFAFSTTVMPPEVYNAAVEGFAIIVEKTYNVAQAIANAMRYAKRQPWYKELTPDQRAEFDKQFPKHLETLALKSVNQRKLFREAAQELEVNLNKLIYEDLTTKENAQEAIAKRVQEQLGLSERSAKDVAKFVKRRFDQQLSTLTEQRLKQKFFPKNKGKTVERVRKNIHAKVVDLYNAGAFQPRKDKAFYTAVAEHLNLIPQLNAQQMKRISDLSKGIQKTNGSVQLKIIGELGLYMAQMAPVNKWQHAFTVYMGVRYAAMLSGISTQALNVMSSGFMIAMQTAADMVNVAQIAREGKARGPGGAIRYLWGNLASLGWAAYRGLGRGLTVYRDVLANEGADQKYIEKLSRQNKWDVDSLDLEWKNKDSNVRRRFWRKWGIGIFRWVGASLRAADQFVNTAAFHRELFMAKAFADANNLSIKEVWKDLKQASISEEQKQRIATTLAKEERAYEKATGKPLAPISRRRRYNELLNEEVNLDNKFKEEAEAFASDYTFMNPRNGLLASFANNFGQWLNRTKAGALVKINYLPFTNVVGNIAELMMDTIPGYGFMRAKGYSFSAIPKRIKQSTGVKSFFRPQFVEGTAQMGPRKSLVYNRQMGRAWFGVLGSLVAMSMFMGNDEDDFWQLTGGQRGEEDYAEGLQNIRPKYSIGYKFRGKRKWFNYLNVPMLNVLLAPIGNYNDRMRRSTYYADNRDTINRWTMAWKLVWGTNLGTQVAKDSATMLLDMTFLSGLSNLFTDISESVKWLTEQKPTQAAEFPPKGKPALPVVRNVYRNVSGTVLRVLPWNINIINQLEKIYDPQVYTRKDVANTLKYEAGWHGSDMVVKRDVFGEPIKTLPGQQFVNVDQFFELKKSDPRWEFLDKYNAIPAGVTQSPHAIGEEYRYFTPKEQEEYVIKTGEYFDKFLKQYMANTKLVAQNLKQKKPRKEGGYDTGVQIAVNNLWTSAKTVALKEMIVKLQ